MNWVPLHLHSHCSLLDGLSKPEDIAARCKDYGYKACALTDHGSIAGCVDFFTECKKRDVKPILGCEFYICEDVKERTKKLNHVVILAKNLQGWRELIQCVSASNLKENFYHKPRIDYSMMKQYLGNGNHICISGHPGTAISESLFFSNDVFDAESYEEAKAFLKPMWKEDCRFIIDKYLEIFGDNFFLEIQLIDKDHLFAAAVIGECLREIGSELSIPTVATGDSHYVDREDAIYQRILICSSLRLKLPQVQKTLQKKGKVPLRCFFTSNNYHIPSPEDILSLHTEEEINNAGRIADMCEEYNILSSPILPHFDCPNGMEEFDYLTELCRIGWKEKLVTKGVVSTQENKDRYTARIKEELEIIKEAGLSGYFLIVQDITNWVRSKGWLLGKGRGSAAGSLISYLIGITGIDPIPYNLLFSRFYNSSRKGSLPDIDTDVPSEHRDEVIQYIKDKYGHENVAQMVTYGRLQGRSAMKEVMSIEDALSFAEMNAITEHIPDEADISDELEEMDDKSIIKWALLNRPEKFEKWVRLVDGKPTGELADTFNKAIKLEGTYKTQSKHAAGVIIAASKLSDICPMVRDSDGNPVAGFEMGNLEAIGQVKFDILGVDILSKIQKIAEHGNIDLSDMNCEEAWNLLSEGDTVGVFQLESKLGRTWAKRVKPRNLEELAALVSLIRPGTLNAFLDGKSMTQHYVDRKHGLEPVEYLHSSLEPLLKNTYGVLCYQEQAMLIAKEIAGFTEQEADNLRKAIGKKLADLMAKVKVMFLEGCKKKNVINEEQAVKIFDWIEASNRYSFNASHGYSYGLNSYLSAMCKAKNPTKFYEIYLDHARRKADTQEEIKGLVYDARVHNIEIYPPKLGNFYKNFTIVDKNIYFGISLIKDIGEKECDKIIEAFPNTKEIKELSWIEILAFYSSKINKKAFVALISSGCFDGKNRPSRNKMLYDYDIWKENITDREIEFIKNNIETTEDLGHHINVLINNFKLSKPRLDKLMGAKHILEHPTNSLDDEISWISQVEKNYFGVSLTCSASDMADPDIINADCKEIYQGIVKGPTNIGVTIDTIREFIIKKEGKNKGKKMAFLSVSDNTAALDSVVAFPDTYEQYKKFLYEGNTVILIGKPSEDKKDRGFIIDKVCQI